MTKKLWQNVTKEKMTANSLDLKRFTGFCFVQSNPETVVNKATLAYMTTTTV